MAHLLDNPVWHALSGPHGGLGREAGGFRAYRADIAVFAGAGDPFGDLAGIEALVPQGGSIALVTTGPVSAPAGLEIGATGDVLQMVAERFEAGAGTVQLRPLDSSHVPAMMDLVALTRPGPFAQRTIEMGGYVGVFDGARLVAMSGRRMRVDGFTEVSAVCTHPDYRGAGYATALVSAVGAGIVQRGETPFLHVIADNAAAIRTYERVGFVGRRPMTFTMLRQTET